MSKKTQNRICVYFQTKKEIDKYNSLVSKFMVQNKVAKKSEAIKQMLFRASQSNGTLDEAFKEKVMHDLQGIGLNTDWMETLLRYLVNDKQVKEGVPSEIVEAFEKESQE